MAVIRDPIDTALAAGGDESRPAPRDRSLVRPDDPSTGDRQGECGGVSGTGRVPERRCRVMASRP